MRPGPISPTLRDVVEITHQAWPLRGRVVGRTFSDPQRIDIALAGGGVARDVPVNGSLRILEPAA